MNEYISREKAIETIQYRVCQGHGNKELICKRGSCAYCGIMEIMSDISSIEAADVQPVKHGKWLPSDSYITTAYGTLHCDKCSECGADVIEGDDYDNDFCPNCGARMDGEQK
jgi:hypothetical protein